MGNEPVDVAGKPAIVTDADLAHRRAAGMDGPDTPDAGRALADECCARFGSVDILATTAEIRLIGPMRDLDRGSWQRSGMTGEQVCWSMAAVCTREPI